MARKITGNASGLTLALIIIGIALNPILLASSRIGSGLSITKLVGAVIIATVITLCLSMFTLSIGEKARRNTYQIVSFPFGSYGAKAINILMAISLFGWICVTALSFSEVINIVPFFHNNLPLLVLVTIGCIIFITITQFGFNFISKISLLSFPVIGIILLLNDFIVFSPKVVATPQVVPISFGVAVSAIVGTIITLVCTLPDFGMFAINRKHTIFGAILGIGLLFPLLYLLGAYPSSITHATTLISAMKAVSVSIIPAVILLLLATVIGNSGNMYQGTQVVATFFTKVKPFKITILLGVAAVIIDSSININLYIIPFLLGLGVMVPPIAGIYVADFVLFRRKGYHDEDLNRQPKIRWLTFLAWIIASMSGYLNNYLGLTLTTIPALDSFIIASCCYTIFNWYKVIQLKNSSTEPTINSITPTNNNERNSHEKNSTCKTV